MTVIAPIPVFPSFLSFVPTRLSFQASITFLEYIGGEKLLETLPQPGSKLSGQAGF